MARIARKQLSYANAMATIAVFVALGGGAYAAKLAKNSVGANQIKKSAVAASEIKANAVGASEVAANAVGASETAAGSVGSAELIDGSVLGADVGSNALTGTGINESTLFNDNSLNGADIDESSLVGMPTTVGGVIASGATDTVPFSGGSITYECSNFLAIQNDSGSEIGALMISGAHNDVAAGTETIFSDKSPIADATSASFAFTGRWGQGVVITGQSVVRFELWNFFQAGECDYALTLTETPVTS